MDRDLTEFGKVIIKGFESSFEVVPGVFYRRIPLTETSYGINGRCKMFPPIFEDLLNLYIVLKNSKCEFHCSYCSAIPQLKFIEPSNKEFVVKLAKSLSIDHVMFRGFGEYVKTSEALDYAQLLEKFGISTVLTCNFYEEELKNFLDHTNLTSTAISLEIPTSYMDRASVFSSTLDGIMRLNEQFPGKVSIIALLAIDGDIPQLIQNIKLVRDVNVCCSWGVIAPVNKMRNKSYSRNMLEPFLIFPDMSNLFGQSVLDTLLHGLVCTDARSLNVTGDRLVTCPVTNSIVPFYDFKTIVEKQKLAAEKCTCNGQYYLECPFYSIPRDTYYSHLIFELMAVLGEKYFKEICESDDDIEIILRRKNITSLYHPSMFKLFYSGRRLRCDMGSITFLES